VFYGYITKAACYLPWLGIAIETLNIPQEKCFLTCAKMPVSLQADIMTFFTKHKR
jgi:hypothetical protein